MSSSKKAPAEVEEDSYVDVRSLPLRPPQQKLAPERAVRRPWHPVMWDDSIVGLPSPDQQYTDNKEAEDQAQASREYPHKQRLRNLRRLIADGKIKPDSEMLIFFLCNKFAASEERENKISV